MQRIAVDERSDWKSQADALGFNFHTMYGEPYWGESACYRFTLRQIENDIEDPTGEIEQLCFQVVARATESEEIMAKLAIPEFYHWCPV